MKPNIRKLVVQAETVVSEAGRPVTQPCRKITAAVIAENPFAGRFVDDLVPLYTLGADLAEVLVTTALEHLGHPASVVTGYGKGAVIGTAGELEHAAALLHPAFGAPVRTAIGGGKSIIPSTKKLGGPGTVLVLPIVNCNDIWRFDDMDAAEITIPDAPRADEVLIALTLTVGGRPLKRVQPVAV